MRLLPLILTIHMNIGSMVNHLHGELKQNMNNLKSDAESMKLISTRPNHMLICSDKSNITNMYRIYR